MSTTDHSDETEWVEMRGIVRVIAIWLIMLVVAIVLLFVLKGVLI
jgi:hypothetical protein